MNKYNDSKIYKITSPHTDKIYIGSTTQKLNERLNDHKNEYNRYLKGTYHYITSIELIKLGSCNIELIEAVNVNTKAELEEIEGKYIRNSPNCVNITIPTRTKQEYQEDKKQQIKEQKQKYNKETAPERAAAKKKYRIENKEPLKEKRNLYMKEKGAIIDAQRKEVFKCGCGSQYTRANKAQHAKSDKHLKYILSLKNNNPEENEIIEGNNNTEEKEIVEKNNDLEDKDANHNLESPKISPKKATTRRNISKEIRERMDPMFTADENNETEELIIKDVSTNNELPIPENKHPINKYNNSIIYQLSSPQTDKVYIGSTIKEAGVAFKNYKSHYKKYLKAEDDKKPSYLTAYDLIKYDDCIITVLENVNVETQKELSKIEAGYIKKTTNCINKIIPGRTDKERYQANREHKLEQAKAFSEANPEKVREYSKNFRKNHKDEINEKQREKYICVCGSTISKVNKSRHEKSSKIHIEYKNSLQQNK
jgi:hypothetical protein